MGVKRDSFNRTGEKGGERYVRLPISQVEGAISLNPGDKITLKDVKEADIFPECEQPVIFDPNMAGSDILVKDPAIYGKQQDYGDVIFDPNNASPSSLVPSNGRIILETGGFLLLENGGYLLLENANQISVEN